MQDSDHPEQGPPQLCVLSQLLLPPSSACQDPPGHPPGRDRTGLTRMSPAGPAMHTDDQGAQPAPSSDGPALVREAPGAVPGTEAAGACRDPQHAACGREHSDTQRPAHGARL